MHQEGQVRVRPLVSFLLVAVGALATVLVAAFSEVLGKLLHARQWPLEGQRKLGATVSNARVRHGVVRLFLLRPQ